MAFQMCIEGWPFIGMLEVGLLSCGRWQSVEVRGKPNLAEAGRAHDLLEILPHPTGEDNFELDSRGHWQLWKSMARPILLRLGACTLLSKTTYFAASHSE